MWPQLHMAAKQLGDWTIDQKPDLVLLISHQVFHHHHHRQLAKKDISNAKRGKQLLLNLEWKSFQGVRICDSPSLLSGATAKGLAQMHGLVGCFNPSTFKKDHAWTTCLSLRMRRDFQTVCI